MTDLGKSVLNAEPGDPAAPSVARFTNADLLCALSRLSRDVAGAVASLSEGAWNPNFCSADASDYAASIFHGIRAWLERTESRVSPQPERVSDRTTSNTDAAQVTPSGTPIAGGRR